MPLPISRRSFAAAAGVALLSPAIRRSHAQNVGPFRHGVASGDPTSSRVVIWSRFTPGSPEDVIPVEWVISTDPLFDRIVQRGFTSTGSASDYTIKVDVGGLRAATTYFYRFIVRGANSPAGRTRTLPSGSASRLRFAVASCSNYPYGFFNAYRLIANRSDLDCVLHLGDYIYEYANAEYGDGTPTNRLPDPPNETVTLGDYRRRYAQYRSDPDLQEVHRQHPFIVVWDDHESANDAWKDGAQNHQAPNEGDWAARRAASAQAWFEWMPVRENVYENGNIYRTFRFGDLADIIMLDTRLAGRDQQVPPANPAWAAPNRTLLGAEQESWLFRQLNVSAARGARWRLIGQQTMMGQLFNPNGQPFNTDQWDGYLASRTRVLEYLNANSIGNVTVLTGDIHSSWANEVSVNPFAAATAAPRCVEFVTPGITSPAIEDARQAAGLEAQVGATHPHVKYVNLFRRGYLVVDVDKDRVQAEWYHIRALNQRLAEEDFARAFLAASGSNRLTAASGPAPAPAAPPRAI